MIEQLFEFIVNHYILTGILLCLTLAFFINEGRRGGASISTSNLVTLVNREDAVILDVREGKEFSAGHIAGAINIPHLSVDSRIGEVEAYREKPVVLVCKMGQHSGSVGKKLKSLGFGDVRRLSGGMAEWSASNLPVVK